MFLYVIGPIEGHQKIGFSKNVERRLKTLQTGNSNKLYIHHVEEVPDNRVRILETKIHRELNYKKKKGEWFDISSTEAKELLQFFVMRYTDDISL